MSDAVWLLRTGKVWRPRRLNRSAAVSLTSLPVDVSQMRLEDSEASRSMDGTNGKNCNLDGYVSRIAL